MAEERRSDMETADERVSTAFFFSLGDLNASSLYNNMVITGFL